LGFEKLALFVMAATICRPFASFSVIERFLRLSLILATGFSFTSDLLLELSGERLELTGNCVVPDG
jgi:hypothetical protein